MKPKETGVILTPEEINQGIEILRKLVPDYSNRVITPRNQTLKQVLDELRQGHPADDLDRYTLIVLRSALEIRESEGIPLTFNELIRRVASKV